MTYRLARNLILALFLISLARPCLAQVSYLAGNWNIMGTLIVESGDPRDPTRPKPGYQKPDRWVIVPRGSGLALTSPAGTIQGVYTAQGAHFEGRYPLPLGQFQGFVQIKIEVMLAGPNFIKGGEEILYFMPNGLGQMQPFPAAREAWTFLGQRY